MANANAQVAPKVTQVTVPILKGLTAEQSEKVLTTFANQYVIAVAKGEADKKAYERLHKKYATELLAFRNEERKSRNVPGVGARS